jgi:enoyl-CoA hydratase/carnithine racemase
MHDIVIAAERPARHAANSARQLLNGRIPIKKVTWMQLVGRNISGAEADRLGIVSHSVAAPELEATIEVAREIASRHLAPLEHAKIAVQVGRDLSLSPFSSSAPGCGKSMDPTADIEGYPDSQKGGPNLQYKRPDV